MGLFGKKKDLDEEEIDEEFETEATDEFENRKLKRQLRDLKSENKKTRKEPPKPWGEKERMIILIVLVVTTLISSTLFLISNNSLEFRIKNLELPNINFSSFNIFKEETIMIEKK